MKCFSCIVQFYDWDSNACHRLDFEENSFTEFETVPEIPASIDPSQTKYFPNLKPQHLENIVSCMYTNSIQWFILAHVLHRLKVVRGLNVVTEYRMGCIVSVTMAGYPVVFTKQTHLYSIGAMNQ